VLARYYALYSIKLTNFITIKFQVSVLQVNLIQLSNMNDPTLTKYVQ